MKMIKLNKFLSGIMILLLSCGGNGKEKEDGSSDLPDIFSDPLVEDIATGEEVRDLPGEEIEEKGIKFIVRNTRAGKVYINWANIGNNVITGARTTGGAWSAIFYWPLFCVKDCADATEGGECCLECSLPPSVRKLEGGEEISFRWDGESVYEVDEKFCSCPCYRVLDVYPMGYLAKICVYPSSHCWSHSPCEPDSSGIIEYATVEGEESCYEAQFDIPYAGNEVVIRIE